VAVRVSFAQKHFSTALSNKDKGACVSKAHIQMQM
jgi:hypothetical protein